MEKRLEKVEFEESNTRWEAGDGEDMTCGRARAWCSGPQPGGHKESCGKLNKKMMSRSLSNPLMSLDKTFCLLSLL